MSDIQQGTYLDTSHLINITKNTPVHYSMHATTLAEPHQVQGTELVYLINIIKKAQH